MKKSVKKRIVTFFNSDTPLTSKRVKIILANSKDSEKLANAVRKRRFASATDSSFEITEETKLALEILNAE
ncbi:hypothetical protein [Mangrovibacterium marinum]|uniref:hypothetical protein n=1 Tax=Mangrovibacterium marinum TaxID=1639118 RepID=UPI002A18DB36|nr:hypothetical protein [Mangrovibacterium marinum]